MSYEVVVSRITNIRPHPNADRIKLGSTCGSQVVVGLDTQEGELGLFFDIDGVLDREFAEKNNLLSYKDPITGERKGGFFDNKVPRIRAQKFRGEKSEGFWCGLNYLKYIETDISSLKEGDRFTSIRGKTIASKYYSPATLRVLRRNNNQKTIKKSSTLWFPQHIKDTTQLRHILSNIPSPSLIWVTEKLHGTSQRYGQVLDEQYLSWWKRKFNKIYPFFPEYAYTTLVGTKNVILNKTTGDGFYGNNDFRYKVIEGLILKKGEVLYGEVVGYVHHNTPIMPSQLIKKSEIKDLIPLYGDTIHFKYGCKEGESKFYVYRIIHMGEDGHYVELSWPQVKKRCRELGILHVPDVLEEPILYRGNSEELADLSEKLNQGSSLLDSSHIREGVVLRMEHDGNVMFTKDKSFHFKVLEGIIKSVDNYVDMEEVEGELNE